MYPDFEYLYRKNIHLNTFNYTSYVHEKMTYVIYADKIKGTCLNCLSEHQEEFIFKVAFGLRHACDAVNMAKELVG
jgi:hypothetical protein